MADAAVCKAKIQPQVLPATSGAYKRLRFGVAEEVTAKAIFIHAQQLYDSTSY